MQNESSMITWGLVDAKLFISKKGAVTEKSIGLKTCGLHLLLNDWAHASPMAMKYILYQALKIEIHLLLTTILTQEQQIMQKQK